MSDFLQGFCAGIVFLFIALPSACALSESKGYNECLKEYNERYEVK